MASKWASPEVSCELAVCQLWAQILHWEYFRQIWLGHNGLPWSQKHRFRRKDCPSITKGAMGFQRFSRQLFLMNLVPDMLRVRINNKTSPVPQNILRPKSPIWLQDYTYIFSTYLHFKETDKEKALTLQNKYFICTASKHTFQSNFTKFNKKKTTHL